MKRPEGRSKHPGELHAAALVFMLALSACDSSPPKTEQAQSAATPTMIMQAPTAEPPPALAQATATPVEELPRTVAGIELGSQLAAVKKILGTMNCHENPEGFRVCVPETPPAGAPPKFEVYFVHETVVSLAYERDIGPNVWDFLSGMMGRYGQPSLSGANQVDKQGRTHEIYGWKDARSIYSVRFVWKGEAADRQLTTTAITLWDRAAYQTWETEKKRAGGKAPTPAVGEPT
jgi:hypothetical protein